MKRCINNLVQITIAVFFATLLNSCYGDTLNLDRHYVVIDYHAQDIRIGVDNAGGSIGYLPAENDTISVHEYVSGDSVYIIGEWFKIILYRRDPMHIVISVDENQTEKDRSLLAGVHADVDGDTVRFVQRAKPGMLVE